MLFEAVSARPDMMPSRLHNGRCWCKESEAGVGLDFKSPGQILRLKSQEHIQKAQEPDTTQIRNRVKCSIKPCDHEKMHLAVDLVAKICR